MDKNSALLIVDVQNDFCPGGSLPVPDGDRVVPVLNRYIELFNRQGLPVFASRDWHPLETSHFLAFGGIWPAHCVEGTKGAEFHPVLKLPPEAMIISKGMDPARDDYSAMHGVGPDGAPFPDTLKRLAVTRLYIGGLATDYCVKESVLAALKLGFAATLLADASRGVEIAPGDSERAVAEMRDAGAGIVTLDDLSS